MIKQNISGAYHSFFPKLTKVWLEVSDLCNSRCSTCSAWKKTKSDNILDIEKIFSNSLFKDVVYILNSGSGEPSLADLKSILLTEHRVLPNATLQVSTNGLLPDKVSNAVYAVLKNGAKIDVGVSLDGIGANHDLFRGVNGNFDKVKELLERLQMLKMDFPNLSYCVGSTLTDYTAKNASDLEAFSKSFNAGFMWNWYNNADSFYGKTNFAFSDKMNYEQVAKLPDSPYRNRWLTSLQTGKIPKFKCYALRSFCAIRCTGDVVPCLSKYDLSIGNLMVNDANDVWHSKQAKKIRENVAACEGCLNSWGCNWSLNSEFFECLRFRLKNKVERFLK